MSLPTALYCLLGGVVACTSGGAPKPNSATSGSCTTLCDAGVRSGGGSAGEASSIPSGPGGTGSGGTGSSSSTLAGGGATIEPPEHVACGDSAATVGDEAGVAPDRLFAASGNGKVLLLWNAPARATAFAIYRATSPHAEVATPIADNVTGIRYVDTSVVNGTRYYYRVAVAVGPCPGGALSEEASAKPTDADATTAFQAAVASENSFLTKTYVSTPLPTYSAESLPKPILDDFPDWLPLYSTAWELAFKDLKQPTPASGFVSNFIDAAFNGHIFQWDTVFMLQFGAYAQPYAETMGSLDNFYAKQHPDGFICREINQADGADVFNTGDIKDAANPPLYSWAEWRHYAFTGDPARLASVIIPISKHYDWLRKNRTRANGTYFNTGFGAGEDDLERKDPESWVDMTTQQAQNAIFSAFIATLLDNDGLSAFFVEEYLSLAKLLDEKFWDPTTTMFTDLTKDGTPTHVKTALAFWPLVPGVASFDQANALQAHLSNPAEFWRTNVVPVLAADQEGYTSEGSYWNGAVWAPTNYVVIDGLQGYGFHQLATLATRRYLSNMSTSFQNTGTIWEHYAPEGGAGSGMKDFVGWSGLGPIALLIESVLGIRVDGAIDTVQWRPTLARRNGLTNLNVGTAVVSLVASPIADGSRTLTISTTQPIRVAIDTGSHQGTYAVTPGSRELKVPAWSF